MNAMERDAIFDLVFSLCPHEPYEHAEGTCEVCDYAFAVETSILDQERDQEVLAGGFWCIVCEVFEEVPDFTYDPGNPEAERCRGCGCNRVAHNEVEVRTR